ncbi:hypothetical protein [Actinosynnema sp. NPDC020468]|uniref:hypothetical protein n=1 Tax=Actinosynnema sp. NPDC020468 TaxID=3154488 RepID=UPI00340E7EE4
MIETTTTGAGPARPPYDEELLRDAAYEVVAALPGFLAEDTASRFHAPDDLVDAIVRRGAQVWDHLDRRDRSVPHEHYPLLAAATLAVRTRPLDVQKRPDHVAAQYDRLVALGDVPIGIAVQSRMIREDLGGLLVEAYRLRSRVRSARPDTPAHFVGMVVCAVLGLPGDHVVDTDVVLRVLDRADALAARHRSALRRVEGVDTSAPALGNVDLFGQVAGYRVAIAEAVGRPPADPDAATREHAGALAGRLRAGMTGRPGREAWNAEPDALIALRGFVKHLASDAPDRGTAAEELFQWLQRDLTVLSRNHWRETPSGHDGDLDLATGAVDELLDLESHAEHVANWLLAELYSVTDHDQQALLDEWLTGARPPTEQEGLLFLIDRVRRVDLRFGRLPARPSRFRDRRRPASNVVADRVRDALKLGLPGREIAQCVLPPLWTDRGLAAYYVRRTLQLELPASSRLVKAVLLSALVVRAPAQEVERRTSPDLPERCPCGEEADRVVPPHAVPCAHRRWLEPGVVENYTTLARAAGLSEAAAARQLQRHQGRWREWVDEFLGLDGAEV